MTEPTPPPGSFDWIVGGTALHAVDVPLAEGSQVRTLRVEITARARVAPNRPWGYILLGWGLMVLALLGVIAINPAHSQPIDLSGPPLPREPAREPPREVPRGVWVPPVDGGRGWGEPRPAPRPMPAWGPPPPTWGPSPSRGWGQPAWGQQEPGRTTSYSYYTRPDGTMGRCAVSQWRSEPTMRCE